MTISTQKNPDPETAATLMASSRRYAIDEHGRVFRRPPDQLFIHYGSRIGPPLTAHQIRRDMYRRFGDIAGIDTWYCRTKTLFKLMI